MLIDSNNKLNGQQHNLENLLSLDKKNYKQKAVTTESRDCFQNIQDQRLGTVHYMKKYICGTTAFMGAVALPVGLALGTAYVLTPHLIAAAMANPLKATLGALGAMAGNKAGSMVGVKPFQLAFTLGSMALVYGAGKVSDIAVRSFVTKEKVVKKFQQKEHENIITSLTEAYNLVAAQLEENYKNANDPEEMYKLKTTVSVLEDKLKLAEKACAGLGLSIMEIKQVMKSLNKAIREINNEEIKLLGGESDDKARYNIKLLAQLPEEVAIQGCIPKSVLANIQLAKQHTLGVTHSLKKHMVSLGGGVLSGAVATLGIMGIAQAIFPLLQGPAVAAGIAAFPLAVLLGVKVDLHIFNSYTTEREMNDELKEKYQSLARETLVKAYEGMGRYLGKNNNKDKELVFTIGDRLPRIQETIESSGLEGMTSEEVIRPLSEKITSLLG